MALSDAEREMCKSAIRELLVDREYPHDVYVGEGDHGSFPVAALSAYALHLCSLEFKRGSLESWEIDSVPYAHAHSVRMFQSQADHVVRIRYAGSRDESFRFGEDAQRASWLHSGLLEHMGRAFRD
jgi:hypothetical protein